MLFDLNDSRIRSVNSISPVRLIVCLAACCRLQHIGEHDAFLFLWDFSRGSQTRVQQVGPDCFNHIDDRVSNLSHVHSDLALLICPRLFLRVRLVSSHAIALRAFAYPPSVLPETVSCEGWLPCWLPAVPVLLVLAAHRLFLRRVRRSPTDRFLACCSLFNRIRSSPRWDISCVVRFCFNWRNWFASLTISSVALASETTALFDRLPQYLRAILDYQFYFHLPCPGVVANSPAPVRHSRVSLSKLLRVSPTFLIFSLC